MPLIKKRIKTEKETVNVSIDKEVVEKLDAYAAMIEDTRAYVIEEALGRIFEKDSEFADYLNGWVGEKKDAKPFHPKKETVAA